MMHEITRKHVRVTFEWEVAEGGEFVNVNVGDVQLSLDPAEAWELADWLSSGQLSHLASAVEEINSHVCGTWVWSPFDEAYVPCGSHNVYCPGCEYRMAVEEGYDG